MTDPNGTSFARFLGTPLITDATGDSIPLPTKKSLALLAMVAASGTGGLPRDVAAATLWSRSPEQQARTNLRQTLSGLRAAAGADVIRSSGAALDVNRAVIVSDLDGLAAGDADIATDVAGFGGVFLDGFNLNEPPFEEWVSAQRAHCAQLVRDYLLDAGTAALDAGQARTALQISERLLALDPFEEAAMGLCLKSMAANGERARMARRLDAFARVLQKELGVAISGELVDLKEQLSKPESQRVRTKQTSSVPMVMVTPFAILSDNLDHRYFADGLVEDVITQLSKFSTVRVNAASPQVPAGSAEHLDHAAQIGARFLLLGSVRWSGARVRVSVELIAVDSGSVIWAERLDRDGVDLFHMQDDLSGYLVGALPYRIEKDVAERAVKKPQDERDAYELMILGKSLRDTISVQGNLEARELLERAVSKDPGIARSHMYLSDSFVVQHWFGGLSEAEKEKTLFHARKAAELDPSDVHIQDHLGFALMVMGHWSAAKTQIQHALSMAENEIESISWCAYALMMSGDHASAREHLERVALRRTTLPPTFEWILGQMRSFQGQDSEAVRLLNGASLLNALGLAFRAGSQARLGAMEEARFTLAEFQEARRSEQSVCGLTQDTSTIEAALDGYRGMWRRGEDWAHIAEGLRLAGLPD